MMTTGNRSVDEAYRNAERKHAPSVEYPQLNIKVYIVGNCFRGGAIELFARAGCRAADSVKDADLVVFLGGEDVDPSLYGERCLSDTYFNASRDKVEMEIFTRCVELGKPMFGICRGMQFLHVMNGGKLYQDVLAHTSTHLIRTTSGRVIRASSMHHQMCIDNDTTFPLAFADSYGHGHTYTTASKKFNDPDHRDLEAAVYPNIGAIAVQGHPEVGGYAEYSAWCLDEIKTFLDERHMVTPAEVLGEDATGDYINPDLPFLKQGVDC